MIEKFLLLEEKYNLLEKEIDKFYYWAYIRFNMYMRLEEIKNDSNNKTKKESTKPKMSEIFKIVQNCSWKNPISKLTNKDILIINHPRKIKRGEYYECIYTEDIARIYEDRAYTLEFLYGWQHFEPIMTPGIVYMDYVDIFAAVKKKFMYIKYKSQIKKLKLESTKINDLFVEHFGFGTGANYIFSLLEKRFFWHLIKKKMLRHLINKVKPKVVIETVGYETNKMIINEICNELGIPTIELQHGVMGRGHLAYNYSRKKQYPFFPKKVLIFSEYWREVTSLPIEDEDIISVGFPYLEKNIEVYGKKDKENSQLKILVISQPEFSTKIANLVGELLYKLERLNIKFQIIYKLHPAEYNSHDEKFNVIKENQNVEFVNNNTNSIYYYFARANVQIGVTSTAIFEGLAFNLPTFIYHIEKTDMYMKDLVQKDIARMFDNVNELVEMLLSIDVNNNSNHDINFWEQNALDNIIKQIENSISEKRSK